MILQAFHAFTILGSLCFFNCLTNIENNQTNMLSGLIVGLSRNFVILLLINVLSFPNLVLESNSGHVQ